MSMEKTVERAASFVNRNTPEKNANSADRQYGS
jgi:hypothetical protein